MRGVSRSHRAELSAAAETLETCRTRVAALVDGLDADRADLVTAIIEAERALETARRLLVRAEKIAR